jgi:hypothetical protein
VSVVYGPEAAFPSWPGLTRPSHGSRELIKEIMPIGILSEDKIGLPGSRPVLDVLLPLDRRLNIVVMFCPHETFQAIFPCETVHGTFTMFPYAMSKITRHTDIEHSVSPVREDVNPAASYSPVPYTDEHRCNALLDGRVKPGHDDFTVWDLRKT